MNSKDKDGEPTRIQLKETEAERDIGVVIDNKQSFKEHIAQVTAKANRVVGIIRRSFDYLTPSVFILMYKSLVRPILEYGPHLRTLR